MDEILDKALALASSRRFWAMVAALITELMPGAGPPLARIANLFPFFFDNIVEDSSSLE